MIHKRGVSSLNTEFDTPFRYYCYHLQFIGTDDLILIIYLLVALRHFA